MTAPADSALRFGSRVRSRASGVVARRSGAFVLLIICEIAVLLFSRHSAYYTSVALEWATFALLAQGFNLISGYAGRLAFGNVIFFGISSYLVVAGAVNNWYHELIGLPIAIVACCAVAYLLSLGLWRVNGLLFALATFALATMLEQLVTVFNAFGASSGLQEPLAIKSSFVHLALSTQFGYLVVGAVLVLAGTIVTAWFGRSTLGREVQATRDDRVAAGTSGISTRQVTAVTWMLSAGISAVAGIFYAQYNLFVEPTSSFGISTITLIVVPAILGGMGTVWGPVVGSIIIPVGLLLSRLSGGHGIASFNLLVYGAILVLVLRIYPGGLVAGYRSLVGSRLGRTARAGTDGSALLSAATGVSQRAGVDRSASASPQSSVRPEASGGKLLPPRGSLLEVVEVQKSFGGVRALQGVSFSVGAGEMVGLLGPNGAGKSTLFNCIAGVETPDRGQVVFGGQEISRSSAPHRARLGIARTYQTIRLFPKLTALENVTVGTLRRSGRDQAHDRALEMLAAVGLAASPADLAGSLSLVDQRRVELARAMVTDARLVMLDEVMTGLNDAEVEDMRQVVRELNEQHGAAFVIVEHVMGHILPLISRVVIMVQGEVLADGIPSEILERNDVLEAYFGKRAPGGMARES